MISNRNRLALEVCAGLSVAPAIWIINTQLGRILVYLDCQHRTAYSAIASFAGAVANCVVAAVSWRAAQRVFLSEPPPTELSFVGSLSALSALLFAFALLMQGAASLVLSGCQR
ncbi:hypothetical protein J6524_30585 [Bradyrhizobium sp. WSM 1738]|uniref:hypothetical protein n=1 Tax=Bradyrhizobium hereditatis TaxID=2821405 RepID=UPI001CE2F6F9|nr:hypothetical protein [Bradyrhizobium hereditatis]MCA6119195.1 hypothetical protein [Bradyrhizobium hereditatis]